MRSNAILATALAALVDIKKKRLQCRLFFDQALLVRIADQRLQDFTVLVGEPVFPRIGTEDALLLFPSGTIPGERHDARIGHALHGNVFRLVKGTEQIDGEPRMFLRNALRMPTTCMIGKMPVRW